MRNLRTLLAGAILALAVGCGIALGQSGLISRTLTGNEVVVVAIGGPGGSSLFAPVAQFRNSQGVTLTALTSGTLSGLNTTTATLISTAASVSLTVNLPATPYDGQIFEWANGSAGAFTAGTAAIIDGATAVNFGTIGTLAAGTSVAYRYVLSSNSWYRIR